METAKEYTIRMASSTESAEGKVSAISMGRILITTDNAAGYISRELTRIVIRQILIPLPTFTSTLDAELQVQSRKPNSSM